MAAPLVSWTTPTMNRPDTHEALYGIFAAQDYPNLRLHVYDESKEPSPFFSNCRDSRVDYVHAPMAIKPEVTRIGSTRNAVCERARMAGAELIAHADDDDAYAPSYTSRMVQALGDADLAKLAVFRLMVAKGEAAGTLWQWDVRSMGGKHYGLRGTASPQPVEMGRDEEPEYAEATRFGYGFSYVFRTSLWARIKFPEEGTEDYPWVRECLAGGARLVEVDDFPEGCVHVVSPDSASMCWPQTPLGKAAGMGALSSLRERLRWRMLGAVGSMTALPQGQDIQARPGVTYSVLASVKSNHTLKSLTTRAGQWGLHISEARDNVSPAEFGVPAPAQGYRLVHVVGTVSKPIRVPWKTNRLIQAFDKSSMVRAWSSKPMTQPKAQINTQLTPPAPGVAGGIFEPANTMCTCAQYCWQPVCAGPAGPDQRWLHHPMCPSQYDLVTGGTFDPGGLDSVGVRVSWYPRFPNTQIPQLTPAPISALGTPTDKW